MQTQPKAVLAALLPSPVRIGGGRLLPVTLGGLAMLHCIQSPFVDEGEPSKLEVYAAGYILSKPWVDIAAEYQKGVMGDNALIWAEGNKICLDELCEAISIVIKNGFASAAKTKFPSSDDDVVQMIASPFGNGLGYLLTIIETLMFNYKWTVEYTLSQPVATAFVLITAHRINEGADWDSEPSYAEREIDTDGIKKYLENMKL